MLPVTNSPKPPSDRITLSLPVINAAKEVMIIALGEGKSEIVQRVLEVRGGGLGGDGGGVSRGGAGGGLRGWGHRCPAAVARSWC